MRSERYGANPTHHDDGKREGCGLHTHLKGNGRTDGNKPTYHGARPAQTGKALTISGEGAACPEDDAEHHHHIYSRKQRGNTGSYYAELGETSLTVDEKIIAEDVKDIAGEQYPHRRTRLRYAVRELLESIEEHHEGQRRKQHQVIRAYVRHQFVRLSEPVNKQIKRAERQYHDGGSQRVGYKGGAESRTCLSQLASSEGSSYDRSQSVRESCACDDDKIDNTVDERSSTQLYGAVMTYHHRVGEAEHYHSHLSYHDGNADGEQRKVVVACRSCVHYQNLFCSALYSNPAAARRSVISCLST